AAAKAAASAYCRMFHDLYAAPVVVARLFMVYGPGRQDENKLVPYVIRSLLRGESPSFGSGTRPVDWIQATDVAQGFLRLATAPGLEGRRVDLGSGELHTVREVVEKLFERLAPGRTPHFGGRADRQAEQVRRADVETTERLLGWRPSLDLEAGLDATVEWFRGHPS
ncbi:MAG: NAD-dependent epimerase/dehydratase family protein, partial [Acidobacteriota bacterium]